MNEKLILKNPSLICFREIQNPKKTYILQKKKRKKQGTLVVYIVRI
jgi:hypothetical protein